MPEKKDDKSQKKEDAQSVHKGGGNQRRILTPDWTLKRRIYIAISLTTILPVLVLVYYLSNFYISPFTVVIVIGIVLLGWWLVFEVFSGILNIYLKSQAVIKQMQLKESFEEGGFRNEVESLGVIFNILSSKVKESLDQLQTVSQKTALLNKEISQKVNLLASILQVNSLFSKGASAEELLQLLIERLRAVVEADLTICILRRDMGEEYNLFFFSGTDFSKVTKVVEDKSFKQLFEITEEALSEECNDKIFPFLLPILDIANVCVLPIYLRGTILGFVIIGYASNNVIPSPGEREVMEIFVRNISILWEHRRLTKKVEDLEIFDALTEIYNEKFLINRLEEEIQRAITYQRPCSFVVANFTNYKEYQHKYGNIETEKFIKRLVKALQEKGRPIDIMGRVQDNKIGVILIERNKRQGRAFVDDVEGVIKSVKKDGEAVKPVVVFAIAENPVDGTNVAQLMQHIQSQFRTA